MNAYSPQERLRGKSLEKIQIATEMFKLNLEADEWDAKGKPVPSRLVDQLTEAQERLSDLHTRILTEPAESVQDIWLQLFHWHRSLPSGEIENLGVAAQALNNLYEQLTEFIDEGGLVGKTRLLKWLEQIDVWYQNVDHRLFNDPSGTEERGWSHEVYGLYAYWNLLRLYNAMNG